MTTANELVSFDEPRMSPVARLSLEQYDLLIQSGAFDARQRVRMELIHGELRDMAPIGPLHDEVVSRLTHWSIRAIDENRIRVRVQGAVGLPPVQSVPEPDVVWVAAKDYSAARPVPPEILLVIEVAESSLAYDTSEKARLYAAAEIPEYWVVNLPERSLEVRRDPASGHYRSLQTFSRDQEVQPLAAPSATLRPAMLWPG